MALRNDSRSLCILCRVVCLCALLAAILPALKWGVVEIVLIVVSAAAIAAPVEVSVDAGAFWNWASVLTVPALLGLGAFHIARVLRADDEPAPWCRPHCHA